MLSNFFCDILNIDGVGVGRQIVGFIGANQIRIKRDWGGTDII